MVVENKTTKTIFICVLLVISILIAYFPVKDNDFVNFDDSSYIYKNKNVSTGLTIKNIKWAFTKVHSSNWHPITWISHMIDCELFGLNPKAHHCMNLLFHIINSLLLFVFLNMIIGKFWETVFIAFLFALHPLHVESVAWIAERKDLLSTMFMLMAGIRYSTYVKYKDKKSYLFMILYFILGLMSKPMIVTFPFLLVLLDIWPLGRIDFSNCNNIKELIKGFKFLIYEKLPLFFLSFAFCLITYKVQYSADAVSSSCPFVLRMSNVIVSYFRYIIKVFYPFGLSVFYYLKRMPDVMEIAVSLVFLIAVFYISIRKFKVFPWLAVGWLWYLGTLVPVIGLIQVGKQAMADRYTYIPLTGIFIIITFSISYLQKSIRVNKNYIYISAIFIISILMFLTYNQVKKWENTFTLFTHVLKVTEESSLAHNNLGVAYYENGNNDKAIYHYEKSVEIDSLYAMGYYNMGLVFIDKKDTSKALKNFRKALHLDSNYIRAYISSGEVFENIDVDTSEKYYYKALSIDSNNHSALFKLGKLLYNEKKYSKAIEYLKKAALKDPYDYLSGNFIGLAYSETGDYKKAFDSFSKTIKIKPDSWQLYNNFGTVLLKYKRFKIAKEAFSHAVKLKPDEEILHFNMARVYLILRRPDSAIIEFKRVLEINPKNIEAGKFLSEIKINELKK